TRHFFDSFPHGILLSFPTRRSSDLASWIAARVDAGNLLAACADSSEDALTFPLGKIEAMRSVRVVNITDAAIATPTAPPSCRVKDRKSTRLNSSHEWISYAVFCLKK